MSDKLLEEIKDLKAQQEVMLERFNSIEEARKNEEFNKIDNMILMKQTFAQELTISDELLLLSDSKAAQEYVSGEKSEKIELFLDLVESILSEGEKVVVFCKYRTAQGILKTYLENRFKGIQIAFINGSHLSEERYNQLQKFNNTKECNVLIASNAGAEGGRIHALFKFPKLTGISLELNLLTIYSDIIWGKSNYLGIVKKIKIGQSAAKYLW